MPMTILWRYKNTIMAYRFKTVPEEIAIPCITYMGNTATIDYLSFTIPTDIYPDDFIENALGIPFEYFEKSNTGRNGYRARYHYENITVLTEGGLEGMGNNITLTGKACYRFNHMLNKIINDVFYLKGHFTRVDLKIDDYHGLLDINEMQEYITEGLVVSPCRALGNYNEHNSLGNFTGKASYIGSRKSGMFIRIYDKALKEGKDYHWVRVELELKRGYANALMKRAQGKDLGEVAKSTLKHYLSFRERGADKNRSRWPVAPWWDMFLDNVEKLKLISHKEPATQGKRLEWFMKNAATFAELVDVCGQAIIPVMYREGKMKLERKEVVH
jgi:phage replication initiation protein